MGIELHESWLEDAPRQDGLWARHLPAWEAFLVVSTQWRTVSGMTGLAYIGLDYAAAKAALEFADVEVTPEVWRDLQDIEHGAILGKNGVAL